MSDIVKFGNQDKLALKSQQNNQFSERGLYIREDDQDWGSAGMNDIQKESETNQ
tara:strand:- start:149 stop:310 length:162 start_codon:yes stop_codon:yes gene_type:complete